ncbi:MAG: NPCBM/NEW2 domain-containing protein, partial [Bacteroidales bacterium]|nr:NPCBM/NEW2 domain-containing protein [Bacteroidales bacterium]
MKYGSKLLAMGLLLSSLSLSAAGPKKVETWLDASVKAKTELQAKLRQVGMPVVSQWMKKGDKAAPFSVNVAGMEKLVLLTVGGPDGSDYDQAVWGNAKLIAADGSSVWLDQLDYVKGKAGWDKPRKNINAYDHPLSVGGKKYEHGMFCHADGMLVYTLDKKYVRFEAEVGIDDESDSGSAYFHALNAAPTELVKDLQTRFPAEAGLISRTFDGLDTWLVSADEALEPAAIRKRISKLSKGGYYMDKLNAVAAEKKESERLRAYLSLLEEVQQVYLLQQELQWLDVEALKLAYADLKKQKGYDVAKYEPLYNEVLSLVGQGFDGIYNGDETARANARKALNNRRAILLGNPLLDSDKIVAAHYRIGEKARQIMTPALGTQGNNWSNQESARRGGFDAEIVELSNLRGDMQMRQVYKPANGSSIADLRLHWDGDRVMFTQTRDDKRWNVFEVKLDGTGFKPLIENEEPDLEFYDGTYLPDGRILAISNIGYQGVPCVNGNDAVGNLVLYDPAKKNLRRLTYDQDANWNP